MTNTPPAPVRHWKPEEFTFPNLYQNGGGQIWRELQDALEGAISTPADFAKLVQEMGKKPLDFPDPNFHVVIEKLNQNSDVGRVLAAALNLRPGNRDLLELGRRFRTVNDHDYYPYVDGGFEALLTELVAMLERYAPQNACNGLLERAVKERAGRDRLNVMQQWAMRHPEPTSRAFSDLKDRGSIK